MEVGRFGVFVGRMHWNAPRARAIEALGFGALWIGGSPPADLGTAEELLAATERVTVGTSIVNIWDSAAGEIAASWRRLEDRYPGRFALGIGVGHPEAIARYESPYQTLVAYLDALDAAGVPPERRLLAALGDRVLGLAAARGAGALPYLVTPEHTARARAVMGPGVFLAPEHMVVVDPDAARARELGRARVANPYLGLRNYVRNLLTLGFDEADVRDGGSDRLVDALALHGTPDTIASGLWRHLDAGADHVAVQPLFRSADEIVPQLEALAPALVRPTR